MISCIFRKLGAGPINIILDKAPCHTAKVSKEKLETLFDNVWYQTPKSPDLNMLDAGVFPWMERQQQKSGATTKEEIRGSVLGVWRALQPPMLKKIADHVRLNATKVTDLNGKNFYHE